MRPVLRTPGIYYRHESFLNDVHRVLAAEAGLKITEEGAFAEALVKKSSGRYQKQLKRQVDADLRATHAITQRRSLGETGGPGGQFDLVQLGLAATLIAGGYASWKVVADDVRAAVRRLRRISRDHVVINEDSAILLAVDAVAAPGTFATIDIRFVAPITPPRENGPEPERGYLVGLDVNEEFKIIVLSPDGEVVGISPGMPDVDFTTLLV
jgi:hypothetical protein